jgi:glycosyltransferase involved in cell wall biosynthesis
MKVALIGNMNNNYFALLRYMRDMGVDAELLMYEGEGAHFAPENDTWEIEKWMPYIKQTKLNSGLEQFFTLSAKEIRSVFKGYDHYIGCGFTPAYFYKAGLQLDLFTPYCVGIEYTYRITKTKPVHYIKEKIEAYYQKKGLRNNTKIVGTIDEESRVKANTMGVETEPLPMLMIYNKEKNTATDAALNETIEQFKQYYPVVFSHVSHYPVGSKTYDVKRNDVLIKGFAEFVKQNKHNPLLVLLEYGEGVEQSKQLIRELGIENRVMWFPLMSRKIIMQLLQHVHFGGGEFGGAIWGGTGWEFMAKGVPFFQHVDMSNEEFEAKTKLKTPDFFNVKDSNALAEVLDKYATDREASKQIGNSLQSWFDKNAGQDLAAKYVNLCAK